MGKRKKDKSVFKIKNFQPNDFVTSSSIMIECKDGTKVLCDLGMAQDGKKTVEQIYKINKEKYQIPFDELDAIVISHLHNDHVGMCPIVAQPKVGFRGSIIATELTAEMATHILYDGQRIHESEIQKLKYSKGIKLEPLFTKEDVDDLVKNIRGYGYFDKIKISQNLTLELLPASHIAGASQSLFTYDDGEVRETLLYTGDIYFGTDEKPFTKSIIDKTLKVNHLIIESTYGLQERDKVSGDPLEYLEKVILDYVVGKNKTLWIPVFAMGRSTALYYYMNELLKKNEVIREANIPIYFAGQLMHNGHTTIGKDKYTCFYDEKWNTKEVREIFNMNRFTFLTQRKDVEHFCYNNTRKIVFSSSGMADKGYSALLADSYVSNGKVVMCSCGYMADGSLGRAIRENEQYVNVNGQRKKVRLEYLGVIPSIGGHASYEGLIAYIKHLNQNTLKNIVLVHGTTEAKESFKNGIEENTKNKNIFIIKQNETIKLYK